MVERVGRSRGPAGKRGEGIEFVGVGAAID